MASAGEAQEDGVADRAPSRVIIAGVSPEMTAGDSPSSGRWGRSWWWLPISLATGMM